MKTVKAKSAISWGPLKEISKYRYISYIVKWRNCIGISVVFGRHFRFSFSLSLFDEMLLSFSPILVISIFESFSLVLV